METLPAEPPSASLEGLSGLLIAIIVLIVLSMIFSSSESAFLSINKLRIRFLRSKRDKKAARVGKLLDKKDLLLNTLLVGNNIVNIAITSLLTSLALKLFGQAGVGIATLVATVLLLIFGEIAPKTIGTRHPEPVAFSFSVIISFFMKLLSPLVFLFTAISRLVARIFGIKHNQKSVSFTEEEIKSFIDVGEEEGVLEENEKNMMHKVFKFTDLAAKEVMVPRTRITAITLDASYNQIIELSQRTRLSRFPVYKEDIDHVVGILYVKDMLFHNSNPKAFSVKDIMRPPLFVVGTKKMSSVQQMLRENKQSLAVVIDEYSGTDGILSIEDIAEEIFGTISDEYYTPSLPVAIQINSTEAVLDGAARLTELSEKIGISLQSEYYETLGGYITEKLDRIPCVGDKIQEGEFLFTVIEATSTKVTKIRLSKEGDSE
ncbi:MAG: HlyC/CorC family transporter [Spirochaetaceae bacterium]|nr:HlyC/CorC family transporter [Spirochaetaceae bacterium]